MASPPLLEHSPLAEPDADGRTMVVFAGSAKYAVGGGKLKAILVRRVTDGQQIASLEAEGVTCLNASRNGKWIGAGTVSGELLVWDAKTYKRVFEHKERLAINAVYFYQDSAQFLSSHNRSATEWDIASGKQLQTYDHEVEQTPTRSSPRGDPIAVTAKDSIRVYDDSDGRLLFETVRATFSRVLWFRGGLVVICGDKIEKFQRHTGSKVAEWLVPYSEYSRIAVPEHEEFIAYCANHTVTFWDASTHVRSGLIERPLEISSVAFSPDDRLFAIAGVDGEVVIREFRDRLVSDHSFASCVHFAEAVIEDTLVDTRVSLADAISTSHYQSNHASAIISLVRVLIKRSKVYLAGDLWELALDDANKVIKLAPLSPWGYERKYAALYKAGDHDNALDAFETMLSRMSQSPNPRTRGLHRHYINPTDTRAAIRQAIQDAIRDSPPMLIHTTSGRLLDKTEQATSFESQPVFKRLISSMTTIIDHTRIEHDIRQYYRHAMLSHTWQDNEPLFEDVTRIIVYDLEDSPANDKLKMFCRTVRDAGIHWAWSDTCCINRRDDSVLQEALVATYRWYRCSALTLILLNDVHSPSQHGDLIKSKWNTCAWSFQQYHASKVVRFYNKDWTLYRDIDEPNHKESPEILSEMEEATGISTRALEALQPGLDNIRKKLSLVSRRETALVKDEAYLLLGIFAITLPAVYGDGDQALGRLLAQILSHSGDASILAWTGQSGCLNSCLPGRICVFRQLPTSHIPSPMTDAEMEITIATLKASSLDIDLVLNFYDRLRGLPAPFFVGRRMRLPCLGFPLGSLSVSCTGSEHVSCAQTVELGNVEIRTMEDLSRLDSLILVHPWIDFLLGRWSAEETMPEDTSDNDSDESSDASRPTSPLLPDKYTTALQLIARLRQPFGALLLAPAGQDMGEYRRVASESLITVQVQDDIFHSLMDRIQILDVL